MQLSLNDLLLYKNEQVVSHYCHLYPHATLQESRTLFADLLAWMWLSTQRSKQGKKSYLFGPLLQLDAMWHVFILHTRDYIDFCMRYFGEYFHHEVEHPQQEHNIQEEELRDYLEDCFIFINQEWVTRRFLESEV